MKKSLMLFAAIVMMASFSSKVMAQTTTDAGAVIVDAITLTQTADLHFGVMTLPSGDVDIVVTPASVRTASVPANITLLGAAPTAHAAAYTVAGGADLTYAITLPADATVEITETVGGLVTLAVNDFNAVVASEGAGTTGTLSGLGADSFNVGATLTVPVVGTTAGIYYGTFDVDVAYN